MYVIGEVSLHKPYALDDAESPRRFIRKRAVKTASKSVSNYVNSGGPQNIGMTQAMFPELKADTKLAGKSERTLNFAEDGTVLFPGDDDAKANKKRQSQKPIHKPKCPPGANGPHPHPNTCSKYLSCANGRTFEMDCGPGTLFNPELSVCDHPYNVDCDEDDLTTGAHNTEQPPPYKTSGRRDPGKFGRVRQYFSTNISLFSFEESN